VLQVLPHGIASAITIKPASRIAATVTAMDGDGGIKVEQAAYRYRFIFDRPGVEPRGQQ